MISEYYTTLKELKGRKRKKRHQLRLCLAQDAVMLQQRGSLGAPLLIWLLLGSRGLDWVGQGTADTAAAIQQMSVHLIECFKTKIINILLYGNYDTKKNTDQPV